MRHGSFLRNDRRTRGEIVLRGAENCTTSDLLPSALTSDARTPRDVSRGAPHSHANAMISNGCFSTAKVTKNDAGFDVSSSHGVPVASHFPRRHGRLFCLRRGAQ